METIAFAIWMAGWPISCALGRGFLIVNGEKVPVSNIDIAIAEIVNIAIWIGIASLIWSRG